MSHIFISHVEEDADIALELALGLEQAGFKTWFYELDSIPGTSYLIETGKAIEQTSCFILIISTHSLNSQQVTREVVRAHENGNKFIPLLLDVSHVEFQSRQPEWREAIGSATSITIPKEGVVGILPRIIKGLEALRVQWINRPDTIRVNQIRRALYELRQPDISGRSPAQYGTTLPPQGTGGEFAQPSQPVRPWEGGVSYPIPLQQPRITPQPPVTPVWTPQQYVPVPQAPQRSFDNKFYKENIKRGKTRRILLYAIASIIAIFIAVISINLFATSAPAPSQKQNTASFPSTIGSEIPFQIALIYYKSSGLGIPDICVINSDGSNLKKISSNLASDSLISWSPDGNKIGFIGKGEVWTINPDGSNSKQVTNLKVNDDSCLDFCWSPNSKQIAFIPKKITDIFIINTDGSSQIKLTNSNIFRFKLSWSPKSDKILFFAIQNNTNQIFTINTNGSNCKQLTYIDGGCWLPSWSPDGSKIAFLSPADNHGNLYVMNADGTQQFGLTKSENREFYPWTSPAWSSDSKRIAFIYNGNVYKIDANGSNLIRLTYNERDSVFPSWSPNNDKIAYIVAGSDFISINADGSNRTKIVGWVDGFTWKPVP